VPIGGSLEIVGLIIMSVYALIGIGLVFLVVSNKKVQCKAGNCTLSKALNLQIILSGVLALIMSAYQFYTCFTLINGIRTLQPNTLLVMHYRDGSDIPIFLLLGLVACILGILILMKKYTAYVVAIILYYVYIPYGIIKNTVTLVDIVCILFFILVFIQWKKARIFNNNLN